MKDLIETKKGYRESLSPEGKRIFFK